MILLILIAVSVLIGLKAERWRGVIIGAASVAAVYAAFGVAINWGDMGVWSLALAGFLGGLAFLVGLAVIALTFAIRRGNRRPAPVNSEPSFETDQNREG